MKVKFTWLLALKIFIVLFWTLGMIGFIFETINNPKTFLEILSIHWVLFTAIFLGCISVILDFFFKEKEIMIDYFLSFFLLTICFIFINMCIEYIRFLKYGFIFTSLFYWIMSRETIYLALWFVYFGFALCGTISYFQKNYKRAIPCFAFCCINFIPFTLRGQIVFA